MDSDYDPVEEVVKGADKLFSSMADMLQVFSDAFSVCQRPLWTASAASRIRYGEILPDVFDKETAMWLRTLAIVYTQRYSSLMYETDWATYERLGLDKGQQPQEKITLLMKDRERLERYSQHTVLTGDLATGKVNRTLVSGYNAPDDIRSLITHIRRNGKLPDSSERFKLFNEDHGGCFGRAGLEKAWVKERSWDFKFLEESYKSWKAVHQWSFKRAVYTAWVVYNEVRLHQAEMTILSHQIMKSKDDEVRKVAELLQQPSATGFKSADEAKKWMDEHENEIAEAKKLLQDPEVW